MVCRNRSTSLHGEFRGWRPTPLALSLVGGRLADRSSLCPIDILGWFGAMYGCYQAMPAHEKTALLEWERTNLDGCTVGTSDWPGWEKYIGKCPQGPPLSPRRQKQQISADMRWAVFLRDDFRCVDCGTRENLSVDHIIPEIHGGPHEMHNFCTRCKSCNCKKGTKMPEKTA